tara:strand:- start:3 stop:305 length:303 start_codon:yes stop_codon:yes gene_type:complete
VNSERLYKVLVAPHVSEKSALIGEIANQYAFKVAKDATRSEIKTAVERLFNVSVVGLQVLNVKGKVKRNARGQKRRRPNWKKAYVRLDQGHEIDFSDMDQ